MTAMTLHEALVSRRTAYSFTDEAIDDDVVARALDAMRWAPNHKLTQPWRVILVGPQTRGAIAAVAEVLAESGEPPDAKRCRELAIAINGVIDGLWIEGTLVGHLFSETPLPGVAIRSVEALLGGISLAAKPHSN